MYCVTGNEGNTMSAKRKRRARRKPSAKKESLLGNLLLEVIAIIALLFVLLVTKDIDRTSSENQLSYQSTGVVPAVSDFVSDQLEYQKRRRFD